MTDYAPSFRAAKLYEKTSQQEGSRLRQKLVHLQYRAKLQEHITLAVTRIREDSAAARSGRSTLRGGLLFTQRLTLQTLKRPASIKGGQSPKRSSTPAKWRSVRSARRRQHDGEGSMPGVTITIAIQDMAAETITVEAASDEQRKTCATPSIASLPTANLTPTTRSTPLLGRQSASRSKSALRRRGETP